MDPQDLVDPKYIRNLAAGSIISRVNRLRSNFFWLHCSGVGLVTTVAIYVSSPLESRPKLEISMRLALL